MKHGHYDRVVFGRVKYQNHGRNVAVVISIWFCLIQIGMLAEITDSFNKGAMYEYIRSTTTVYVSGVFV